MTTTAFPNWGDVRNGEVTGAGPHVVTLTDDGGCAQSDTIIAAGTDGKIRFVIGAMTGPLFFSLNSTNDYVDIGDMEYACVVVEGDDFQMWHLGNVSAPNYDNSFAGTAGYAIEIERAGCQVFVGVDDGSGPKVVHVFEDQHIGDLSPSFRSFSAGSTCTATATLGQARTYFTPNTVKWLGDGNSLAIRAEPKTVLERMAVLEPFLGSGTEFVNVAVDGQTTEAMIDRIAEFVTPEFDPDRSMVADAWEITNQTFNGGSTGVEAAEFLGDYFGALRAVHPEWITLASGAIPAQRSFADGPTLDALNAANADANAYIRAHLAALNIDVFFDMTADPPWDTATFNAAYFTATAAYWYEPSPNCLHQTDAGQQLTAERRCAVAKTLPGLTLSSPAASFLAAWARGSNTVVQS